MFPRIGASFPIAISVTFAPPGAFGVYQGESVFTHGAIIGIVNAQSNNLREASQRYVEALLQSNPYLRQRRGFRHATIDGNQALSTRLVGRSNVTGRTEVVTVYTTMMRNGNPFYVLGVTPQDQSRFYNRAFRTTSRSLLKRSNYAALYYASLREDGLSQ